MPEPLDAALKEVRAALLDPDRLVRAVGAGARRHGSPQWTRVDLRPVVVKGGRVLQLVENDDSLHLKVEDNGRGIQEQEAEKSTSLGFLGLRERALAFGGSIDVRGQAGKGTCVAVRVPLQLQPQVFHA